MYRRLASLVAASTVLVALPAMADPVASVGGTFFSDYSVTTGATTKTSFSVKRAFLTGKVKMNETFSGQITLNPYADTVFDSYTASSGAFTTKSEPFVGLLQLAFLQADGICAGNSTQIGLVQNPWFDAEAAAWGYRMLGSFPLFKYKPAGGTGYYAEAWDLGVKSFGSAGPVKYGFMVSNGEGYRAPEAAVTEKSLTGVLTYVTPLEGLELSAMGHSNVMGWTGPAASGPAYRFGGMAVYKHALGRVGFEGTYTQDKISTGTAVGNVLTGFAVIPLPEIMFPWELVFRADMTDDDTTTTARDKADYIAGVAFKPTKGVTIVLDAQNTTANSATVGGGATNTNLVALHTQLAF